MKIFISGGGGFLGTHLHRSLLAAGHEVTAPSSKELDLRDRSALNKYQDAQYDRVYHLAAWTQAGDFCLHHPGEQWIINQEINTNVLDWWKEHQPQAKLIAIGSSCCYEPGTPHREENFLAGRPIESLFTYAMTKRMLYTGLLALNKQFALEYLFLVPSTLYGPDYHLDGRQMHFIFDLMRKIVDGAEKGEPVVLWGDGLQRRELIHVRDFVRAALELSDTHSNDIVNIGGGSEFSIREFAEILSKIIGFDQGNIRYDTTKYVGAKSKVLEIDKLQQLLPTFLHTELEAGLRETVEWFRAARATNTHEETERYLELAEDAIAEGKESEGRTLLRKASALEPNSPKLQALRTRLTRIERQPTASERTLKASVQQLSHQPIAVDQFLPYFNPESEVGQRVHLLNRVLTEWGFVSSIYAEQGVGDDWKPFDSHRASATSSSVLMLHPGDGNSAILPYLISAPGKKFVYYHGITPPAFFESSDPDMAEKCRSALEAVGALRPFLAGAFSDSEFGARHLQALGYPSASVLTPPFIKSEAARVKPSPEIIANFRDERTNILFAGDFAPHKCQHEIINCFAAYQRSFNPRSRLFLAGSPLGAKTYVQELERLAQESGAEEIIFTGQINRSELAGYYKAADIFLCLSEHEVFCTELLEAMYYEVPIIAYDCPGVSETLASCARMIRTKENLRVAAQLDALQKEQALRNVISSRQLARLDAFSEDRFREQFADLLEPILRST